MELRQAICANIATRSTFAPRWENHDICDKGFDQRLTECFTDRMITASHSLSKEIPSLAGSSFSFTIIYDFKHAIRCLDQSCQVHSGQQGHPSLPTDLKRGSSSPWALHKNNSRLSFLLRQGDGSSLMVVRTLGVRGLRALHQDNLAVSL